MRVVFMGTPDFAVPSLARLLECGHEVPAVFTQPDKPAGRGHKLTPPPVKKLAAAQGLTVYQPDTLRDEQVQKMLRDLAPDVIAVVAYGKLLPPQVLEIPRLGCVNVHGSLLPKYRGAAPIQWSVLNGDSEAGVTTMYMAQGLDCGDMILKESVALGKEETSGELYERLAPIGADLLIKTLDLLEKGNAPREKQDDALSSTAPMLTKQMARLDFTQSAEQLTRLINGMNPWPVAHTLLDGNLLKVYRARPAEGRGAPGEVLAAKGFAAACGQGALELLEIQAQGSKRMAAADYLRGHPVKPGTKLGE